MKPVTDPAVLQQLNSQRRPVTDPAVLAQLNFGLDFAGPEEATRAAIAKLPDQQRSAATDLYGRFVVATEPIQNDLPSPAAGIPFSDEIASAGNAALSAVTGGRFGRPYDEAMAVERARRERSNERYPVLSTAATVGGALTLPMANRLRSTTAGGRLAETTAVGGGYGAVAGLSEGQGTERLENAAEGAAWGAGLGLGIGAVAETARGVQRAAARTGQTGAYDKFSQQLGDTTLDQLADDVAGGATRQNANINRQTLDMLGEEMVRAGNPQAAAQATVQRLVNELGMSAGAATARLRRLTQVHRDSPLMLGEYPAVAESNRATRLTRPENVDLAEASQITNRGTQDTIDYLANSGVGRAVDRTRNAVEDRQAGLGDWFRDRLQAMAPGGQTLDDAENMIDGVRRLARQDYDAAYNAPGGPAANYRILHGLLPRVAERHLNRMRGRSGEQAQALRAAIDELYIDLPTGQRVIMPSLQIAQDQRQAIRGMIERADRAGNTHIVATLRPLYQDITRVMERASPAWAQANRRWAGMSRMEDALEFGQRLSSKASVAQRQALREFDGLAPEAQDLVRVGWLQQQFDRLGELRDTHDVSKIFDKQNMMATVTRLFGRQEAVTFARAVRDAEVANRSTRMLGNSATHRRGMMQRSMDTETGIVAAAENASLRGARNWLVERMIGVLRDRRNVPLSDIVTTPMADTAAVAGHLERGRRAQARLQHLDRPAAVRGRTAGAAGMVVGSNVDDAQTYDPAMLMMDLGRRPELPGMMRLGGPKPDETNAFVGVPFGDNGVETTADISNTPRNVGLGERGLNALNAFGEVSLAFGPMGHMLSGPAAGMNALMRLYQGGPRAAAATVAGERALPPQDPQKVLQGLQDEVSRLIDHGKQFGINPGPMPDLPLSVDEEINLLTSVRDNLASRIAGRQAKLDDINANAPPTSVPATDARPAIFEREDTLNALARNPYVQPIPGRQGFPTKREQQDLARNYFDRGSRLPPAGPWGRGDITPEDIRAVMQGATARQGRTGAPQNMPSVAEIMTALGKAKKQIKDLEQQLLRGQGDKQELTTALASERQRVDRLADAVTHLRKKQAP